MGNLSGNLYLCNGNIKSLSMRDYFIKTKQTTGETTLYTRIRKKHPSVDINVNTRIKVDIADFRAIEEQKRAGLTTALEAYLKASPKRKELAATLYKLDQALTALAVASNYDADRIREQVDEVVARVVFPVQYRREQEHKEIERLQAEKARKDLERLKAEQARKEEEKRKNVLSYLSRFIAEIKNGERKYGQDDYRPNTVKAWGSFAKVIGEYYKKHPFTWTDVNKAMIARFVKWMEREGYMVTSINKYLITFRAMMRYAKQDGYHTVDLDGVFGKKKVKEEYKSKEIYLTADELQALYDMELTGAKEIYRDVFLIGCYTCQRFSDYSRIEKGSIYSTEKGTRIIELTQVKTGNKVYVPILNNNLETLLAKYDYNVPSVSDVVLNRYIKEILHDLSETVPSLAKMERTRLTMKERAKEERGEEEYQTDESGYTIKPRWAMVSTHTARRTGITLLYKSGLFDIVQIMHVSGHKDTKTFMEYIKLSGKEVADSIALTVKDNNANPFG